jgi:microcystin-dependent protein
VETVTLTTNQIASHTHVVQTSTGSQANAKSIPGGNVIADEVLANTPNPPPFTYAAFVNDANQRTLGPGSIQNAGGNQPHDNMVPFLCINFILSLFGVFPSQN